MLRRLRVRVLAWRVKFLGRRIDILSARQAYLKAVKEALE
jgi:hypothetical protein